MKRSLPTLLRAGLVAALLCFGISANLQAQNCTVNANIDLPLCANAALNLNGSASGLFSVNAKWTQVAGPSVTIANPNSLTTAVTGYVAGNSYTFRLSAKCADGSLISDDVTYTVKPISTASAGVDIAGCPGTVSLAANVPGASETGQWTIIGANNAGVSIALPQSATSSITLPTTSAGNTTLRWTITNSNSCQSFDDIVVSNSGGVVPVSAGPDQALGNCYSTFQSTDLNASLGGNLVTQRGTWSLVSGPNNPTFGDIHSNVTSVGNLVEGTYVLQWTVVGPCAAGSDQMTITVAAATQGVTNATASDVTYCNGTTEALLVGTVPTYSNETVKWTQTQGPAATITNPTSPSTAITGLNGSSPYTFVYTITGPNGCTSSDNGTIRYFAAPTINAGADQILACGVNSATINFTFTGGSGSSYRIISGPTTTGNINLGGTPAVINNLNTPGTYVIRFTRTSSGITCSNAFDDVSVTVSEAPSASNAGTPQILGCNIHTTNLAGNAPISGTGFWSQVSGPNTAVIADHYNKDTQISSLIEGVYYFKWTISLGPQCPVEESITSVRVSPPTPTTSIAGPNLAACANSPFVMTGNPVGAGEVGLWTVSPSAGIAFSDATDNDAVVTGFAANTTYTFTWKISNACGSSSSSMDVTTGPITGASIADAGINICLSSGTASATLAAVPPTAGTGTWSVLSGPNTPSFADANDPASGVSGLVDGTYELKWEVGLAGCQSNFDTMLLTVSTTPPAADAGPASITVCGTSTNLMGNIVAPSVGTWTLKSGPASAVIANPNSATSMVTFVDAGVYTFTWSVNAGACQSGINADDVIVYVSLPGTTADAHATTAATIDVCANNQTTLGANTPAAGETGIWSVVGSSPNTPTFANVSSPTTSVTGLITGTYTFRWTIASGVFCTPSTSDVVVRVSTAVNAGADQNLCNQTQTTLTGNAGSTGTWSQVGGNAGPTLTPTGPYSVLVSNLDPNETYTFRYSANAIYSCSAAFDDVKVIGFPAPTVPDAGIDQEKCTGAIGGSVSATLTGNVPAVGTGSWSLESGPTSPSIGAGNSITVNGLKEGIYVFRWSITNGGCTTYFDVMRVSVFDPPSTSVAGANQSNACQLSATLNGNTPVKGIGTWSVVGGPNTPTIDFPNQPQTTISNTVPGTYTFKWTITNGTVCAPSESSVDITFTDVPPTSPNAGVDQNLCNVTTTTLAGNTIAAGTGTWTVSGPNAPTFIASQHDSPVSGLIPGTYTFTWTVVSGGCTLTDDVVVNVYAAPSNAVAGIDQQICPFAPVALSADPITVGTGLWSYISGPTTPVIVNPNSASTTVNGTIPGTYVFEWKVTNGTCAAKTDQVSVVVKANCAPLVSDDAYSTLEDIVLNVPAITGILANDSDPEAETLTVNTTPVVTPSHGTVVLHPDGSFEFTPAANYNGSDAFMVSVCDSHTPTPSCVNDVVNITIDPVNDEPSFVKGGDEVKNMNAGAQTVNNWATSISTGPADESSQTLSFAVTNDNNGLFTVQPSISPSGTLTYTPKANTNGVATVTVILTDNGGTANGGDDTFATQTFTITILPNDPPVADDHTNTGILSSAGATAIDPLTASDVDGTVASYTILTLPTMGTLALNGTPVTVNQVLTPAEVAMLTYDPAGTANGNDTFTFTATDDLGLVDLTAATVTIPVLNIPPVANDDTNTAISSSAAAGAINALTATDADGTVTSYTVVTLPSHGVLALNGTPLTAGQVITPAESATLTYDPTGDFIGDDSFTFTATDDDGDADLTPAVIIIPVLNTPPVADDHTNTAMLSSAGATAIDALTASDNDGTIDSYKVVTLPAHGKLQLNGTNVTIGQILTPSQVAFLTYDPDGDTNGDDTFTFTAIDDKGAEDVSPATVTIPVLNIPPVADDHTNAVVPSQAGPTSIDALTANDADGTVVSYTIVSLPSHGILGINGTPVSIGDVITPADAAMLTYDPDGVFNGPDTFTFTATDNDGDADSSPATVTVPVNSPPVANNDATTTDEDVPVTLEILVNDSDDVGLVTSTVDLDPSTNGIQKTRTTPEGVWTIDSNGEVTFTPALNYNGLAVITYTVSDASGAVSNVATITVTIDPVNDPPVGVDKFHETFVGVPVAGTVLNDATDPENTTVTVNTNPVTNPANGSITINADGTYAYTPNPGFAGTDVVVVQICDSGTPMPSLCSTLTITINVIVEEGKVVIVPEGFSPNGDGVNDLFVIQNHTGTSLKLQIFNRWGNLVYENDNYQNDWNGFANKGVTVGDGLPDGTYYYVVEAESYKEARFMTIHR